MHNCMMFSALPAFSTINAGNKGGHGFIRRTRLQLIVRAFCGAAFGVRAGEVVGGCFHLGFVFVLVAQLLRLNERAPFAGMHVLVRHERQLVRLDLLGGDHLNHVVISHVDAHGPQSVGINLHKIAIVPFFHDVFGIRFAQRVIVNATLQIKSRICSRIRALIHRALKSVGQLGANFVAKRIGVGDLQCGDGE